MYENKSPLICGIYILMLRYFTNIYVSKLYYYTHFTNFFSRKKSSIAYLNLNGSYGCNRSTSKRNLRAQSSTARAHRHMIE